MIAYKKATLDNLHLQEGLAEPFFNECISEEELKACEEKYPVNFYSPNIFVRIGLFILTCVIAIFSFGLITLVMLSGAGESGFTAMLIVFALISYGALEFMVQTKNHYKSGVDDALMWMSGIFLVVAFNLNTSLSNLNNSLLIFVIAIFFSLRFINILMSGIATVSLFAVIFFSYIRFGEFAKSTAPFLMMGVALLIYFLSTGKSKNKYYRDCLLAVEILSLACIYIFGNYFVVRELSNNMFNLNLQDGQNIPLAWLFWIFTVVIPFIYMARGIQNKNVVLLRMGLILIGAVIFTIRYYYHVLAAETAMIIGGILMIATAYLLIKYLKEPKYGFSDEENTKAKTFAENQIEALLIAETLGQAKTQTESGTQFGGGSGGGAGAGGTF